MGKIYMFDNNTGRELPDKVDTRKVEVLLGSIISDIHKLIENKSTMFCVFTHMNDCDFAVPTAADAQKLKEILGFGNYNYKVINAPNSVWYTNKVDKNIIISDKVDLDKDKIAYLLAIYLNIIDKNGKTIPKPSEMYIVKNTRNSNIIEKTPDYNAAVLVCDRSPCTIIIKRSTNEVIYKSKYGKVAVPYTQKNAGTRFKNRIGINIGV